MSVAKEMWPKNLKNAEVDGKDVWVGGVKVASCWTAEWAAVIAEALQKQGE